MSLSEINSIKNEIQKIKCDTVDKDEIFDRVFRVINKTEIKKMKNKTHNKNK